MRWSAGVVFALVALAASGACGRSEREQPGRATGGTAGGGGTSGGGGRSGGGTAGSVAGADVGSGGCADTRADCACDSSEPECSGSRESFCLMSSCPPKLEDLLRPDPWLAETFLSRATLTACADGTLRFEVSHFEGGSSVAFDAGGNLVYAAHHSSCNTPVCGEVSLSSGCRSCVLVPVDSFPRVGEGGFGGQASTPEVYVTCQLDEDGLLVVPEE